MAGELKGEFVRIEDLKQVIKGGALKGEFVAIQELKQVLSEVIYKARLPNKVKKFTVDLSTARAKTKLSSVGGGERLFDYDEQYPTWHYFKVLVKGTGNFTIRFVLEGREPVELENTEILKGDEILLEFKEIEFTNTAQSVTNPVFWLEKRYF